jgi:hypothetical protein
MERVSTRNLLQELADAPIGSPELQDEADRIAHAKGAVKPSAELTEAIKRASKLWLPQGRHPARRGACNEPAAEQIDIEDAVESAGGKRGSAKAA